MKIVIAVPAVVGGEEEEQAEEGEEGTVVKAIGEEK